MGRGRKGFHSQIINLAAWNVTLRQTNAIYLKADFPQAGAWVFIANKQIRCDRSYKLKLTQVWIAFRSKEQLPRNTEVFHAVCNRLEPNFVDS